jgi:sugar O-acyltransferase (sialic acid O-acetyltransferase NeuD family)
MPSTELRMPDPESVNQYARIDLILLGAGGHARVLLDIVELVNPGWQLAILARPDATSWRPGGQVILLGDDGLLPELAAASPRAGFVVGVGSVAPNEIRRRLFEIAMQWGFSPRTLVHPSAVVSRSAIIAPGAQLLPACVVNPGARVGSNAIVNTAAVIEHDCIIEGHAHVSPGAVLSGGVHVGEGAHIGTGAVIRQGIKIGEGAQVGAGAVVVKDVAPRTLVVGVPAKPSDWMRSQIS